MSFGWFGGTPSKLIIQQLIKESETVNVEHGEETVLNTKLTKEPVQAVAYSPVLFSGLQEIDGYQTQEGDRILVAGQGDDSQNGIYIVSSGSWVRSDDCNSSSNIVAKMQVAVHSGKRYEDTTWQLDIDSSDVIVGSTPLIWRVESYDEMNGKTFQIKKSDWYVENEYYYHDIQHYMNTSFPNTTIYELDTFTSDYSRVRVDKVIIIDPDSIKLRIPKIEDIDVAFDGYILIEPDR